MKFCAGDPFGGQFRKYIRAAAMWQLLQVTLPDFLEQAATIAMKSRILCAFDLVLFDELETKPFFNLAVDFNSKHCIKNIQAKF